MQSIRHCSLSVIAFAAIAFGLWMLPLASAQTPPTATQQSVAKVAEVEVASAQATTLDAEQKWTNIPEYVAGAPIYAKDPKGGDLEFTAKSNGLVIIAASWTYDGNESGGWYENRTTRDQLVEQGWIALDDLVWTEKDTHTLFFRHVKAGDKFKFHTRKYNQPFLIAADAAKITAARDRFAKALAASKGTAGVKDVAAKPMPTPAPTPDSPSPKPATPEPSVAGGRSEVTVANSSQATISNEEIWSPLPEFLQGAISFPITNSRVLDLTAQKDVQIVVAASWAYDGNASGGWYEDRTTLSQLIAAGWEPIGTIVQKDKGEHTLLRARSSPART